MKTTKCIALLLAIVMTLALFAGCSNSPANDPATDAVPLPPPNTPRFSVPFRCSPLYASPVRMPEPLYLQWFRRFYHSFKIDEDHPGSEL